MTFEDFFRQRNPNHAFLIPCMQCALETDEVRYEDITTTSLRKFKDYMTGEVSNNTLRVYMSVVKTTIRECVADGLMKSDKCVSVLNVKPDPQQNVALTDEEIQRIEEYYDALMRNPRHQVEKDVLTLFLLEIYCGARGVDIEGLSADNIHGGVLSYVSKKTHTLTELPAHHRLLTLIERKPRIKYSRATKNNVIKRVAMKCGIDQPMTLFYHGRQRTMPKYQYLGFHCARRSFVTSLINRGVPISSVSRMSGHRSVNMTQRYYIGGNLELPDAAMSFFNG